MPYDTNICDIKNTQITLEEENNKIFPRKQFEIPDRMKDSKHHCIDCVIALWVKGVIDLYSIMTIEGEFLGKDAKNHRPCVRRRQN